LDIDKLSCRSLAKLLSPIVTGVNLLVLCYQAAIPHILEKTTEDFFSKTIDILREDLDFCFDKLKEIPGLKCPQKAEGGMFIMVKTKKQGS
jgi:aspartate/methionine/tyrosine aminotransferase